MDENFTFLFLILRSANIHIFLIDRQVNRIFFQIFLFALILQDDQHRIDEYLDVHLDRHVFQI